MSETRVEERPDHIRGTVRIPDTARALVRDRQQSLVDSLLVTLRAQLLTELALPSRDGARARIRESVERVRAENREILDRMAKYDTATVNGISAEEWQSDRDTRPAMRPHRESLLARVAAVVRRMRK